MRRPHPGNSCSDDGYFFGGNAARFEWHVVFAPVG
jgi:hypothetical protein